MKENAKENKPLIELPKAKMLSEVVVVGFGQANKLPRKKKKEKGQQ